MLAKQAHPRGDGGAAQAAAATPAHHPAFVLHPPSSQLAHRQHCCISAAAPGVASAAAPSRPSRKCRGQLQPSRPTVAAAAQTDVEPAAGGEVEADSERSRKVLQACTRRIRELGDRGRAKEAIQELASLASKNVQPDTFAATALVRACSRDMELAQSVFDELFGDFLQPDEVTFAVLLRGYGGSDPPNWPKIDATLTTMQIKYKLAPGATSYNALLEVCSRTNDVERGEDIIDRMQADEVMPDEMTEAAVASKRTLRAYLRKAYA